ncbi:DNA-binding protein [Pseudomonas brassicacearum]|nr:DNA-binding protein [Pseudomonas brassicacearum]
MMWYLHQQDIEAGSLAGFFVSWIFLSPRSSGSFVPKFTCTWLRSREFPREAYARLSKMGGDPDMKNSIQVEYQSKTIVFSVNGWLNASHVAKLYSASVNDWLGSIETQQYLTDAAAAFGVEGPEDLIQIHGGQAGDIWLHPKVAMEFVSELDRKLARWCDLAINRILRETVSMKSRFDAACKVLDESRREASEHGRGLLEWRMKKRKLEYRVAHLQDQLQLTLGLDNPN